MFIPRSTRHIRRGGPTYDQPSHERSYPTRDYHPPRDAHSYRDEYSRHPSSREGRFYDTPLAPPPPTRDHRRALTPSRDRRDNPPQPASRYDRSGHQGSEREYSTSGAPSHRDSYDRYDRRHARSDDRSVPYPATGHSRRPRTPPGPPPAGRDDYDKASR